MAMDPKRAAALRGLNAMRKDGASTFQSFAAYYKKQSRWLEEEDGCLVDVFYVEVALREHRRKEAMEWALSVLKQYSWSQDLLCLVGSMYYDDGQFLKSLYYLSKVAVGGDPDVDGGGVAVDGVVDVDGGGGGGGGGGGRSQFAARWYVDGTLAQCHSVSLDVVICSLFKRGYLFYRHAADRQRAVKSWERCFNLISSNVQSAASPKSKLKSNAVGTDSVEPLAVSMYSRLALQCIVNISRIMLQNGQLSSCLSNVRASLQLSAHFEAQFHRKMLFKLALLTVHYLSAVDWHSVDGDAVGVQLRPQTTDQTAE